MESCRVPVAFAMFLKVRLHEGRLIRLGCEGPAPQCSVVLLEHGSLGSFNCFGKLELFWEVLGPVFRDEGLVTTSHSVSGVVVIP